MSSSKRVTAPFKSPVQIRQNRIARSKSNGDLFSTMPSYLLTEKKNNARSRIESTDFTQDAEKVIEDFVKRSAKDVLDLSKCGLTDETAVKYLEATRKQKKIKGLKLCEN